MRIPSAPFKAFPPTIDTNCGMVAQIIYDGKVITDDRGTPFLANLSGGASYIEWTPSLKIISSWLCPSVERGPDHYQLRVWKRRHGPLGVTGGSAYYEECAYSDPWADWLDQHLDLFYRIADVDFKIISASPFRNGVEYWLSGRRVDL